MTAVQLKDNIIEVKPRFPLIAFNAIRLGTGQRYLVKGVFPNTGLAVVWGPPKSGKSFWTFDVVMHVALGWDYRGRRVQQGSAVYCALEGQTGIEARAEAFRQRFLSQTPDHVPLHIMPATLDLVAEHQGLITAIQRQALADNPAVVVLDTLNRSLSGSESSDEDMSNYVRAADAIRDSLDCLVIIVHHSGHDTTRPRGHTALVGAVDAQISVKRDASDTIIATVKLMKDGAQGDVIASRLEVVDVGIDEDGETISSCVVVEADAVAGVSKPHLKGQRGEVFRLLEMAIAEAGEKPPASNHIPPDKMAVRVSLWRRYCYEGSITRPDNPDAKQKAFKRSATQLLQSGNIGTWQDWAWIS